MNDAFPKVSLMQLEIGVLILALGVLLLDLWMPREHRRQLGYVAAIGLGLILLSSFLRSRFFGIAFHKPEFAFGSSYVLDELSLFFKRLFLAAAILVVLMTAEFTERIESGLSEFYSLILFALAPLAAEPKGARA